ncbi:MAG: hypothetical protein HZA92_14610 [Verrucomicrobia bacterium]|nr:hypothetical protein [Verrucomicrobiota bacterium]
MSVGERRLIQRFADGSVLEFGPGEFDDWCVFLTRPGQPAYAPLDRDYFAGLRQLATRQGNYKVYDDFVQVFERTGPEACEPVLKLVATLSASYRRDAFDAELVLCILYAGMVAEENKAQAKLKKRIKRLGVHQVLIEGLPPEVAAEFSKGRPWQELDEECKRRGF